MLLRAININKIILLKLSLRPMAFAIVLAVAAVAGAIVVVVVQHSI